MKMAKESEPSTVLLRSHLGMGDMILVNSIIRHMAQDQSVLLPCKRQNCESIQFMTRDLPVAVMAVDDDQKADRLAQVAEKQGRDVLRLGMFGKGFDEKRWDAVMFEQAGVPFEDRWTKWHVERDLSREFEPPKEPYAFVHQDQSRGFIIDRERADISSDKVIWFAHKGATDNIFDFCRLIENAEEIHVIDSCFAILADSLNTLKAKRKVVHLYAREGALPPTYSPGWEILK